MSDKHPDFIKVVRTLRTERDYTYEQARDTAVRMFAERGWPLPRYMEKFKPAMKDVDGNCCDCNCHLRSSPVVAPSPLA